VDAREQEAVFEDLDHLFLISFLREGKMMKTPRVRRKNQIAFAADPRLSSLAFEDGRRFSSSFTNPLT